MMVKLKFTDAMCDEEVEAEYEVFHDVEETAIEIAKGMAFSDGYCLSLDHCFEAECYNSNGGW